MTDRRALAGALRCALAVAAALVCCCTCGEQGRRAQKRQKPAVVLVDPEAREAAEREREPNDERPRANDLRADSVIAGRIGSDDRDWYRVRNSGARQILKAVLTGAPAVDLVLEAFSTAGKRLVRVDNAGPGGGETLVNLSADPGTIYLRVTRTAKKKKRTKVKKDEPPPPPPEVKDATRYELSYSLRSVEAGEELEPNWKRELASKLAFDEEAIGYLGWHTDTDWYSVDLATMPPGALLRVELEGVDGVRPVLSIRDERGKMVQRRRGPAGEPVVLANVKPPPGSSIFVVVRCGRTFNVESRYSLHVSSSPAADSEVEPNDVLARATPFPLGRALSGVMADTYDRDLYSVEVDKPSLLRVTALPPLQLDLSLAVIGGASEVLVEVDEERAGKPELIPAFFVRPPRVWFRVRARRRSAVDPVARYRVGAKLLPEQGWEREPNDGPETATTWQAGDEVRGFLHPSKDVDHIKVTASRARTVFTASQVSGLKLKLELLDKAGASVIATSSKGEAIRLDAATTAGETYLLRITDSAGGASAKKPYVVKREHEGL